MAKIKGVKWAQVLKLMDSIAKTIMNQTVTQQDLEDVKKNKTPHIVGSSLVFPADAEAKIVGSTLVLSK